MKLLLIQPPVQDFYDTDVRLQPIGLCYLKAAVKKHLPEVEVVIRDAHGGAGRHTVRIPKELGYLTDYYGVDDKSPFSTFHRFYHFGQSFEQIEKAARLLLACLRFSWAVCFADRTCAKLFSSVVLPARASLKSFARVSN